MRIRKRVFVTLPEPMDELEFSTRLKVFESTRLKSRKIDTNGQSSLGSSSRLEISVNTQLRSRESEKLPELRDELELSTLLKVSESTRLKSRKIDTNDQPSRARSVFENRHNVQFRALLTPCQFNDAVHGRRKPLQVCPRPDTVANTSSYVPKSGQISTPLQCKLFLATREYMGLAYELSHVMIRTVLSIDGTAE